MKTNSGSALKKKRHGDVGANPSSFPVLGRRIAELPDRFDYLRNDGPRKPYQVIFVELYEPRRLGGPLSWLVLVFLIASALLFGGIAAFNIAAKDFFSLGISSLICLGALAAASSVWQQLRLAKEDRELRSKNQYRPGLYLDDRYLIIRYSNAFSCFPRDFVDAIRANAKYDSESKQTTWHFVLSYRTRSQEPKELWIEDTFGHQQGSIVRLITRWQNGQI